VGEVVEKIRAKGYRFPIERWTKMVIRPPSAAPTRETIGASKEYMGPVVCNRGRRRRKRR